MAGQSATRTKIPLPLSFDMHSSGFEFVIWFVSVLCFVDPLICAAIRRTAQGAAHGEDHASLHRTQLRTL